MAMQYDVKSKHMTASGVVYGNRTRLKGAIISANTTAVARNVLFMDNAPQAGTYSITSTTLTVTVANTLAAGDRVFLDFTSGTAVDGDAYNPTAYSILVPGEGILAETGIYVGLPANITATTFYG